MNIYFQGTILNYFKAIFHVGVYIYIHKELALIGIVPLNARGRRWGVGVKALVDCPAKNAILF